MHPDTGLDVKRTVSPTPRDIQEDSRLESERNLIHLERKTLLNNTDHNINSLDLNATDWSPHPRIIETTE